MTKPDEPFSSSDASDLIARKYDIEYVVDGQDKVVSVNEAWDKFALSNDAPGLMSEWVVGRDWRNFVMGDATRMYMEAMLSAARIVGKRVGHSYRCDSPHEKRYVKLTVDPLPNDEVRFRHHTTKVLPQKYVLNFVVPTEPKPHTKKTKRCSMCNRIEHQKQWLETEEAVEAGFFKNGATVEVYYGICTRCDGKVKRLRASI